MNYKAIAKNASTAFMAQGVTFCVSVFTTLAAPKVLGVEEYGFWQLFLFYASYVGFFHLGLNDGVYLLNGGKKRGELDCASIGSQLVVGIVFELLVGCLIVTVAMLGSFDANREFVIALIAPFMVLKCTAFYIGYVFQAINETRTYSFSCILERAVFLVPLGVLLLLRVDDFRLYVLAYCFSMACQLVYCLWKGRFIFFRGLLPPGRSIHDAVESVKVGISLMFASIASSLVLGVARFLIDTTWGISTFGQLSLTLSMVNFFLAFVTQAAMVLFPALRQGTEKELARFFSLSEDGMGLVVPLVYVLYWPIAWFLSAWLPQYSGSIVYLVYMIPVCVFESKMSISCTTYFKVARKERELLRVNIATAVVSSIGALIGVAVFKSVYVVIGSATFAIACRSLYSERRISKDLGLERGMRVSYSEIVLTVGFIVAASLFGLSVEGLGLYLALFFVFLIVNRFSLLELLKQFGLIGHGFNLLR